MKFRPATRVIDLLVGEELYTTSDAAIRELLQNAEDACWLQQQVTQSFVPRIVVRFSPRDNWVEVEDNGLGMNEESLDKSFVAIGASKSDVSHVQQIMEKATARPDGQIARFGIGILSCFGIASSIELYTRMDGDRGFAFSVLDYHEEFEELGNPPTERGTRVRLNLKSDAGVTAGEVPTAVRKYARHAEHVSLENADSGAVEPVLSEWATRPTEETLYVEDETVRKGLVSLNPEWGKTNAVQSGIVMSNGGFLVDENVRDLLPAEAVGYVGELDLRPNRLRVLLNREGFKKDEAWKSLQLRLKDAYEQLIRHYLETVRAVVSRGLDSDSAEQMARRCLVLAKGPTRTILSESITAELNGMLPQLVFVTDAVSGGRRTIGDTLEQAARKQETVYFVRGERETSSVQEQVDIGGSTVQITETIRTSLRVSALRAKGASVVTCRRRRYLETYGTGNAHVDVHEADILVNAAMARSVTAKSVEDATPEEVSLGWAPQSILIEKALMLDATLRIANLPESRERVVRDFSGRFLNSSHPEVRRVLESIPDSLGNPIRQALLQAYVDLSNNQIADARDRVLALVTMADVEESAGLRGGTLQRDYLQAQIRIMLDESDRST